MSTRTNVRDKISKRCWLSSLRLGEHESMRRPPLAAQPSVRLTGVNAVWIWFAGRVGGCSGAGTARTGRAAG